MKRIIAITSALLVITGIAFAKDIKTYKATYEKEMAIIILSHDVEIAELGQQYSKALDTLLVRVKKTGDLGKASAVMEEIERFQEKGGTPEKLSDLVDLQNLQESFRKRNRGHALDKARKILRLYSQYGAALERLQTALVVSDKMDQAKAVQEEAISAKTSPDVESARLLVSTHRKEIALSRKGPHVKKPPVQLSRPTRLSLSEFAKTVTAVSGGYQGHNTAEIIIGETTVFSRARTGRGINTVAIHNEQTLINETFDTSGMPDDANDFASRIAKLPDGCFVVLAVRDDASSAFNHRAQRAIYSIGGKIGLEGGRYRCAYLCIGQKGLRKGKAIEFIDKKDVFYPKEN